MCSSSSSSISSKWHNRQLTRLLLEIELLSGGGRKINLRIDLHITCCSNGPWGGVDKGCIEAFLLFFSSKVVQCEVIVESCRIGSICNREGLPQAQIF